jgi:glucuronokinase
VSADQQAHGWAPARASLAGNPSDGYGGAVLALALQTWSAQAWAHAAQRLTITPASPLVQATVERFAREVVPAALRTDVRWETSIPREVGLASSSALVIATLRALSEVYEVELPPDRLAELALAVELEELGIQAGPQDRVAQAYGGLTFMDFSGQGEYERLDQGLLPPLLVAWRPEAGGNSGDTHAGLRDRHAAGERRVREAIERLAQMAWEARAGLLEGDLERFGRAMDTTLDLRARIIELDPRCLEMVQAVRGCGASANYTGSGGAIVAACGDPGHLETVERALANVGSLTIRIPDHNTVTSG